MAADGTGAGLSAAARLAGFQDPSENFSLATITSGGNPNLKSEISNTLSFGVVLQPKFIPGLTISVDRIQINLRNGLSAFTTEDFTAACYDEPNPDPKVCGAFTRLAASDGVNTGGTIITGTSTTFNAGITRYRGEVYAVDYRFPLGDLFGGKDMGRLQLSANVTHNALLTTSVTGTTFTVTSDTYTNPKWVGRFNMAYDKGPLRLTYQLDYLGRTKAGPDASIETTPNPVLAANVTHSVSAQYDMGKFAIRGGVDNLTDKGPSYPQIAYGDILGRRFFLGVTVRLK